MSDAGGFLGDERYTLYTPTLRRLLILPTHLNEMLAFVEQDRRIQTTRRPMSRAGFARFITHSLWKIPYIQCIHYPQRKNILKAKLILANYFNR